MRFNRLMFYRFAQLVILFNIIILCGCGSSQNHADDPALKSAYQHIDSLVVAGKGDSAMGMLKVLGKKIKRNDQLIIQYYCLMAENHRFDLPNMELYADSAMAFFDDKENAIKYPESYLQALFIKGDACLLDKRYNQALHYYDKGRTVIADGNCDNGLLATKLAGIYYAQKNYALAAKYWGQNYRLLGTCDPKITPQKLFFMRQAALNNAGFSFEKSGQIDSAASYYQQDFNLIQQIDKDNILDKYYVNTSSIVVYDNLGGLAIKHGNYTEAFKYLNKCVSIPTIDIDGMRITPFMKLADLYVRTGNYPQAALAFDKSRQLLNKYWRGNPEGNIKWHKLYADYLIKLNQPAKAYEHLGDYIRLSDSLENATSKIFRLDVDRELTSLHQQQLLAELKQQDKLKLIYLAAISVVLLLLIVIVVLVSRNLKRSRKGHRKTEIYASQLKDTLAELEGANKNYIRMMRVMAHDLRNPLWGITGLATMLLDEEESVSAESRHALKLIESTGSNTMDMINELLRSGLDDENEAIVLEEINLKKLLFDSVELLRFKAKDKNQQIVFEADDNPVITRVNAEKMWRAFNNVIVNAIKFSFDGGIITVKMVADDKHITVSVADCGIGISDKNRDSIFEMFTPNKRQGTGGEQPFGLGLSITKKIMEKHGGKVWFTSEVGKGTVFYLELPKAQ
jgi:signal transduction histidine kinase